MTLRPAFACRRRRSCRRARMVDRKAAALIRLDRGDNPLNHAVERLAGLVPVPNQNNLVLGVDPNDISAVADGGEARRGTARPVLSFRVEPPEISIIRPVC